MGLFVDSPELIPGIGFGTLLSLADQPGHLVRCRGLALYVAGAALPAQASLELGRDARGARAVDRFDATAARPGGTDH